MTRDNYTCTYIRWNRRCEDRSQTADWPKEHQIKTRLSYIVLKCWKLSMNHCVSQGCITNEIFFKSTELILLRHCCYNHNLYSPIQLLKCIKNIFISFNAILIKVGFVDECYSIYIVFNRTYEKILLQMKRTHLMSLNR